MPFSSVRKCLSAVSRVIRASVEFPELGKRHSLDLAVSIGGAHHCRIVMDDRNSISSDSHVELDRIGAECDGLGERLDGVLGGMRAISAMTDYGAGLRIAENVHFLKSSLEELPKSGSSH